MPAPTNPPDSTDSPTAFGSPIKDAGAETWQPKRGPVFKFVVWGLLVVIGLLVVMGLVMGFLL